MKYFFFSFIFLLVSDCETSDFDPDLYDYRLPAYTERGNNIAGGYFNDIIWLNRSLSGFDIVFDAAEQTMRVNFGNRNIDFVLSVTEEIDSIEDMRVLENREFIIDQAVHTVSTGFSTDCLDSNASGRIIFQRINGTIIAGTFAFEISEGATCEAVSFRSGRFDYELENNVTFQ